LVFGTLNILPRIFGVHFSHYAILLHCGVDFDQFAKEVIGEACGGALHNLGFSEIFFRSLDFGESFGFCWVLSPVWNFYMFLQDSGTALCSEQL